MDVVLSSLQDHTHVSTLLNFRAKQTTTGSNQYELASDLLLVLMKNVHFHTVSLCKGRFTICPLQKL